jgi:hypothetical protein
MAKIPHTLITGTDGKKYQTYELTGAGRTRHGESGKPWRGFNPSKMGRHWANAHSVVDEWDDLKGVLDREKAAIGALITLREPTKPMLTEAAATG